MVTRAERKDFIDIASSGPSYHYVILGVKEFDTRAVVRTSLDIHEAMALMFIKMCHKITQIYKGHFKTIVLAPEANSYWVDRFWRLCGKLYGKNNILISHGIEILSTTIETGCAKSVYTPEHRAMARRLARRTQNRDRNQNPYTRPEPVASSAPTRASTSNR